MLRRFASLVFKKPAKPLGALGEEAARKEYRIRGYEIMAANFFNRRGKQVGEVDFIARDRENLVFVEVKTRSSAGQGRFGTGAEAVDGFKQKRLLRAAKLFLAQNPHLQALRPRIDVCVMEQDAFDKSLKCAKIITNAVEDEN